MVGMVEYSVSNHNGFLHIDGDTRSQGEPLRRGNK
jgi:hypothetical protein